MELLLSSIANIFYEHLSFHGLYIACLTMRIEIFEFPGAISLWYQQVQFINVPLQGHFIVVSTNCAMAGHPQCWRSLAMIGKCRIIGVWWGALETLWLQWPLCSKTGQLRRCLKLAGFAQSSSLPLARGHQRGISY
uniref:Uncharacterized protein n=1 Tax=Romanomermis culicivorax TaxID=13658 RepID=A0A915JCF0_ROMCU